MNTKPDNKKLFVLLEEYINDHKYENYIKVATELIKGDVFLLIPQYDDKAEQHEWKILKQSQKISLGIYLVEGIKAIAAFSGEETLLSWAQKPMRYSGMLSKTLIELCDKNDIKRIVIDSNLRTMFVLQRD